MNRARSLFAAGLWKSSIAARAGMRCSAQRLFALAAIMTVAVSANAPLVDNAIAQPAAPPSLSTQQPATEHPADRRAQRLRSVRNWGYWLSSFAIDDVVAAPHDLMVVDNGVSANRRFIRNRTGEEVARMKRRRTAARAFSSPICRSAKPNATAPTGALNGMSAPRSRPGWARRTRTGTETTPCSTGTRSGRR